MTSVCYLCISASSQLAVHELVYKQWCQSNFSSIEDIKTRRKRGDFRQKNESIEEMQQFHAPLNGHFRADLREVRQ
jgi:hypothetical protein